MSGWGNPCGGSSAGVLEELAAYLAAQARWEAAGSQDEADVEVRGGGAGHGHSRVEQRVAKGVCELEGRVWPGDWGGRGTRRGPSHLHCQGALVTLAVRGVIRIGYPWRGCVSRLPMHTRSFRAVEQST